MDEVLVTDGEEFIQLPADRQKSRASWLLDTKFVAAVEKSRWGADQRWGYSIVGLNRDDTIIAKLHAKSAKSTASRPPTIDLADDEEPSSSSTKPGTTKKNKTPNKTKRSHMCALLSASYLMRRWWFRASLWRAYDFRFRSFCRIRRASEGSCRVRLVGSIVYWIVGDVVVLGQG